MPASTIPTLCYDERLKPHGGCRLCLVEIKGRPVPLTSCTTPGEAGMEVTTESPKLTRLQKDGAGTPALQSSQ